MSDTVAFLYAIGIYVICLGLIFSNYGSFAVTVVRWAKKPIVAKNSMKIKQPPISFGEVIKCYIPIYQACLVRKTLYHHSSIAFNIIGIASAVGIVGNLINKFVFSINSYVMLAFNVIMLLALLLFYVLYAIITADCAHMYGFSWLCIILCFLIPHIACWYLRNNIPRKMRALHKEEIFHEHSGDTVIRQKHNK